MYIRVVQLGPRTRFGVAISSLSVASTLSLIFPRINLILLARTR